MGSASSNQGPAISLRTTTHNHPLATRMSVENPRTESVHDEKADIKAVLDAKDSVDAAQPSLPRDIKPTFEDYLHFAELQRELEKRTGDQVEYPEFDDASSKALSDLEKEKIQARRALKAVEWGSVFFLITTDILGPFNAPYAFSAVGFVPGTLLYFFMFAAATWTGGIIWHLFIKLDSGRFPIRNYADLAERIYGRWARHVCSILQTVQLIVVVGLISLTAGQSLSQISHAKLCFSVCIVIFILIGMIIGQIRTLKSYSLLANSAVWLNILSMIIAMSVVRHRYGPNIGSATATYGPEYATGPVQTAKFVDGTLFSKVNGIMNMVYAYGGAMIFPDFMAEMRHPMDFWKAMILSQTVIFLVYMVYGVVIYAFQGQYTLPIAFQGLNNYGFQTACNILVMISMILGAGLYGNIGIKLAYRQIIEEWFRGPPFMSKRGRFIWSVMVYIYWTLAFIIVSSIPAIGAVTGVVGASVVLQYTYSFPLALMFGFEVMADARQGETYTPGVDTRVDTWMQWSRWRRGIFSGRWHLKLLHLLAALAAFAMAGLGIWGSSLAVKQALAVGAATSFGCAASV
ncbi:transmembrane amino acid transporter protein-domain-containing protein [Auriculariales sp. MPI-PUGE-AT-0066]|nr:transmembrane amino acid transporter protein-domain-containing protein [Auriculariales sp. MPI-PUGE-AT-0066]